MYVRLQLKNKLIFDTGLQCITDCQARTGKVFISCSASECYRNSRRHKQ